MTPPTYCLAAVACGTIFAVLSLTLVFASDVVFWLFDLSADISAQMLAKRAGILFFGLALLMLLTKNHADNPSRSVLKNAIALTLATLAVLGVSEWARDVVGPGIWLAIGIELALAAMLASAR